MPQRQGADLEAQGLPLSDLSSNDHREAGPEAGPEASLGYLLKLPDHLLAEKILVHLEPQALANLAQTARRPANLVAQTTLMQMAQRAKMAVMMEPGSSWFTWFKLGHIVE